MIITMGVNGCCYVVLGEVLDLTFLVCFFFSSFGFEFGTGIGGGRVRTWICSDIICIIIDHQKEHICKFISCLLYKQCIINVVENNF